MEDTFLIPSPDVLPASGKSTHFKLCIRAFLELALNEIMHPADLETNPGWNSELGLANSNLYHRLNNAVRLSKRSLQRSSNSIKSSPDIYQFR